MLNTFFEPPSKDCLTIRFDAFSPTAFAKSRRVIRLNKCIPIQVSREAMWNIGVILHPVSQIFLDFFCTTEPISLH